MYKKHDKRKLQTLSLPFFRRRFLTALNYLADLLCSRSSSCWMFFGFSIYLSESGQSGCFLLALPRPKRLYFVFDFLLWQRFPFARGQHLNSFRDFCRVRQGQREVHISPLYIFIYSFVCFFLCSLRQVKVELFFFSFLCQHSHVVKVEILMPIV